MKSLAKTVEGFVSAGIITPLVVGFVVGATGSFYGALAYIGVLGLIGAAAYIFIVGEVRRLEEVQA